MDTATVIISITLMGIVYALFSIFIQRRLVNIDRMYELRAHMNAHTKKLIAASKAGATPQELSDHNQELNKITMESMRNQMKPMIVILPVLAVIEYLVLPYFFTSSNLSLTILGFVLNYQLLFIVVIFIAGILLSMTLSLMDRRRLKDKYNFGLLQPSFKEPQAEQPAQ